MLVTKRRLLLPVVFVIMLLGSTLIIASRAAAPFVASEPENGSLSGGAVKVTDTAASGGSAIRFMTATSSGLPQLGFSVSSDAMSATALTTHFGKLASTGSKWVRSGIYAGEYARADKIVNAATANGMGTVITGALPGDQWSGSKPVNVTEFANHMVDMATRYKGKGPGGANPVLELPNESNGHVSAAVYAQLACAVYPRVKAVDANYVVIGASENVYVSDWQTWLTDVYKNGLSGCTDAISFHNYDDANADANNKFGQLRRIMTTYDDANKPVWLTEFGASTCNGTIQPLGCYTEQGQADKIVAFINRLKLSYPWIKVAMVYVDNDIPSLMASDNKEASFGVYRTDSSGAVTTPKAAVVALKTLYGM